jgi:hypothetical protein
LIEERCQKIKHNKLKIGLLLDSLQQPAWVRRMLQRIAISDYAEISLIVLNSPVAKKRKGFLTRVLENRSFLFYTVFEKFEKRFTSCEPDAFASEDVGSLVASVPMLKVTPRRTRYSDYFENQDLQNIMKYELDVLIRLGFRILRGDILTSAKHGVWSLHHGDNMVNRGTPPGVWEVFQADPVTGSILQILTEDLDNGKVLCRSWSATHQTWPKKNRNAYYWKSSAFIPRQLEALSLLGGKDFMSLVDRRNQFCHFYSQRLYQTPANGELMRLLLRHTWRYAKRRIGELLYVDQWAIRFHLGTEFPVSGWRLKTISPPKDRFWADPHVLAHDGKRYIFFEELVYSRGKGHISVMSLGDDGKWTEAITVVDRPYHLSYPFIFTWHDQVYMIPESKANRTIEVYRCARVPDQWEFWGALMEDIEAVDTTLFFDGRKWWMFTSICEQEGAPGGDELFVFYSDSPLSRQWTPHPFNPVVSDVRTARSAGSLFFRDGKLYRPSQDCSQRYGYAVNLNVVTELSETAYEEHTESRLEPRWERGLLGVHTLSHLPGLTVIDAEVRHRKMF